ncbi:phage tail protein [Desulfotomaculum sp. 1211_IL3151]|uniref:phage tail protein n=1 Tax=Desulfotomaculum sp. 1211_IL3151 TaxID=3084055 RepID=UPI002FDAA209
MAEQFYTILTGIGKGKIANANALGNKVNFTQLALGDGNGSYYNPTEQQEALIREVWRGNIGSITVDENNPNWIVIQTIIPSTVGGFMIREAGLFDDAGDLIAIGKYPETYKPVAADGSTKDLVIKMILEVSNTASVVLKVDPAVILATKKDVDGVKTALTTHQANTNNPHQVTASQIGAETPTGAQTKADAAQTTAQAYTDQQIQLVTATGIPKLVSYPYVLTPTQDGQTDFEIPLETFAHETDTVLVGRNTTWLSTAKYSIIPPKTLRLAEGVPLEYAGTPTEIFVVVLKNVPIGPEGAVSAAVLADGTVTDDKLSNVAGQLKGVVAGHLAEIVTDAHLPLNVGLGNLQNYGIASQAEAEAGTASNKYMTPLRTAQAIAALSPDWDLLTLASNTAQVDIAVSAGCKVIEIIAFVQSYAAGTSHDDLWVRFNGDSGSYYDSYKTSPSAGQAQIVVPAAVPQSGQLFQGYIGLTIQNTADKQKIASVISTPSGILQSTFTSGLWKNNVDKINTVNLRTQAGSGFKAGSMFFVKEVK